MKATVKSFRFKLLGAFLLFAVIIFAVLWLLQTVFLQTCYTGMAISELEKNVSKIAAQKDNEDFRTVIDETAKKNSLLIFLTAQNGEVLYYADEYDAFYYDRKYDGEMGHGGENPYLSDKSVLSWQKGAARNLPDSQRKLIQQLSASQEECLGYLTEDEASYVYGKKLHNCTAFPGQDVVLCVSMMLSSVEGTVGILRTQLLWVSILSLVLAFLLACFLSYKFGKPLKSITVQAERLAEGDFHPADHTGFCTELDDLCDTLNQTAVSLERLEQSRQQLLANISHDLRTPLTMIRGYTEMLREISWNDEKKRNQDLGVIMRETDRLSALVNEILEYSFLQALKQKPNMESFDLSGVVTRVLDQFMLLCQEKGIAIERLIVPVIRVRGNERQIERVIYNLIDNAVNHTGTDKKISVTLFDCGENVRFEVTGHGQGIPEEDIPYIWERYYTSRNRKNKETVSGLGLSIAKEILTLHEAKFGVDCTEGCVFWFKLKKTDKE